MWLFEKPIAHRGLHNKEFTENSMGSFRNAIEHGYNIETDVQASNRNTKFYSDKE